MKRCICLAIIIAEITMAAALAEDFSVSARAAVLIDAASGRVLYAQNADTRYPMASTTKIMTALLALEHCSLDESVTASANASGVTGTSIYLGEGETLTMREMLLGLMLRSGNDAAVAIAEHVAGTVADFTALMNERAERLGADARFVTPNGLDAEGHGASATAMALIAREALQNADFREIVSTQRAVIPWKDNVYSRVLVNKNRLLREYEGATGVKTGFTSKAGRCLVFSAMRNDMELIGVVMNCGGWFDEAKRMLDWGFAHYSAARIARTGDYIDTVQVLNGREKQVAAVAECDVSAAVSAADSWECVVDLVDAVEAPVVRGQVLGSMALVINGERIAETMLTADRAVEESSYNLALRKVMTAWPITKKR